MLKTHVFLPLWFFYTVFKTIRYKNIVEVFLLFTFLIGVYFFNLCNSSQTTFSLRNLHICFSMKNWILLYFPNSRYHRAVTFLYTLYESGRFSALELVAENWAFASSSAQCCEEQAGANGFASGLTFMGLFPSFIFNISNTGFLWRTTKTFNTSYSLFFPRDAVLLISENVVWSHFIHYLPPIFISLKLVTQQLILFKIIYITFEICKHCICNI